MPLKATPLTEEHFAKLPSTTFRHHCTSLGDHVQIALYAVDTASDGSEVTMHMGHFTIPNKRFIDYRAALNPEVFIFVHNGNIQTTFPDPIL